MKQREHVTEEKQSKSTWKLN